MDTALRPELLPLPTHVLTPCLMTTHGLAFNRFCCVVSFVLICELQCETVTNVDFTVDKQIQKISRCVLQMYLTKITSLPTRGGIHKA